MAWRVVLFVGLLWNACAGAAFAEAGRTPRRWLDRCARCPGVTYELRGRIDADALRADQSQQNEADFGEIGNAIGLRRARIGLEGEFARSGSYVAEIDLASGSVAIRDLFMGWSGAISGRTQLGHFREPFSLEGGTSARFMPFMERSSVNVLDPARNWGIGFYDFQPTPESSLAMGAFFAGINRNDFRAGPGSTVDWTGKFTMAPVNVSQGCYLLHLGFALAEKLPLDGVVVVNQGPRSSLLEFGDSTTSPFIQSLVIPADFQHVLNSQVALVNGPWWTQAEWYGTFIEQPVGGTVFYHGAYIDTGCFLSGEHRQYHQSTGVFGQVRVNEPVFGGPGRDGRPLGYGAWEIALRFAWLDFASPNSPFRANGDPQGIELTQATFGTNWYLTDYLRMMFNYSYVVPTKPGGGASTAHVFGTRLGIFW